MHSSHTHAPPLTAIAVDGAGVGVPQPASLRAQSHSIGFYTAEPAVRC